MAGRDEVSPVRPCEVERGHGANEHMPSLGGIETPGSFGLTRAPDVNVPECVLERASGAHDMAWLSAQDGVGHGPIQTGDVGRVMNGIVLETAPALRDAACEVRSVFCERPKRARLRDRKPTLKRSALGTRHQRGRLKWRRWCEFESTWPHVSTCTEAHVLLTTSTARGTRGAGPRDDTAGPVCVVSLAGSVRE